MCTNPSHLPAHLLSGVRSAYYTRTGKKQTKRPCEICVERFPLIQHPILLSPSNIPSYLHRRRMYASQFRPSLFSNLQARKRDRKCLQKQDGTRRKANRLQTPAMPQAPLQRRNFCCSCGGRKTRNTRAARPPTTYVLYRRVEMTSMTRSLKTRKKGEPQGYNGRTPGRLEKICPKMAQPK